MGSIRQPVAKWNEVWPVEVAVRMHQQLSCSHKCDLKIPALGSVMQPKDTISDQQIAVC